MITPQRVEAIAEAIAWQAHAGQMYDEYGYVDGGGVWHEPRTYIEGHVIPAVRIVQTLGYGALYRALTWLHDCGEDAGVTVDYLAQRCMPGEVRFGFECITKRSGEDLEVYRERIIQSPLAVVAKWGDSAANLANTLLRQPYVPEDIFSDRVDNYLGNLVFLKPYMPQPDQLVMPSVWVPPAISAG